MDDFNFNEILLYKFQGILIKLLCGLIPLKKWRKSIRTKFVNCPPPITFFTPLGKIYMPYYARSNYQTYRNLEVRNPKGEKLEKVFLRSPFEVGTMVEMPKIYWDYWDITLPRHFYVDSAILETMGNPTNRYAWLCESKSITPECYQIFETHRGIEKDFDFVFTYDTKLLNTLENARLILPFGIWYGNESEVTYNALIPPEKAKRDPVKISPDVWRIKNKNISMICSAKILCPMHKIRHQIAKIAQESGKVDIFGGFNGGKKFPFKSATLEKYRFSIVVENDIADYYMTEKIMDCFASMTIPIYLGAPKVSEFFNPDGIIFIDENTDINKILPLCTEQEYLNRLEAIKDNFNRVLSYNVEEELLKFIKGAK